MKIELDTFDQQVLDRGRVLRRMCSITWVLSVLLGAYRSFPDEALREALACVASLLADVLLGGPLRW